MTARSGIYCWAGPGTVRMIRLKYFSPPVDVGQLMRSYDHAVLAQMQRALGTTDAWVTWSWGFADATEREDRDFLRAKLPHFRALDIRTHAYVQGTNLVLSEHHDDYWCRDPRGRLLPYHRGRKLCCPLNPAFRSLLLRRVEEACREDVDGVFVDNFHFGQIPVPVGDAMSFCGCACRHCEAAFGGKIPVSHRPGDAASAAYLTFRVAAMKALSAEMRAVSSAHGKLFGVNGLDADLPTETFYGYALADLAEHQDYLLVENFNHPVLGRSNARVLARTKDAGVPVFIVSYRRIIGSHDAATQADIDAVAAEAAALGYMPCFKASEFTTHGRWHNLDPAGFEKPRPYAIPSMTATAETAPAGLPGFLLAAVNRWMNPFLTAVYESRVARRTLGWIVDAATMRRLPWT